MLSLYEFEKNEAEILRLEGIEKSLEGVDCDELEEIEVEIDRLKKRQAKLSKEISRLKLNPSANETE